MSSQCAGKPVVTSSGRRIRRRVGLRLRGGAVLAACGMVLYSAWWLEPRVGGYGTHRQLGMPSCSILVRTGVPCPTCGLTTSMALMARGRVGGALVAHPFGVFLFAAVAFLAAAGGFELATGRDTLRKLRPNVWWAVLLIAALTAGWACKLLVGYATGQLPIR